MKIFNKNEVPFITPPELKYEGINYITPSISFSKIGSNQERIIPKNSICVCCIGSLGKLGILKEVAITDQQQKIKINLLEVKIQKKLELFQNNINFIKFQLTYLDELNNPSFRYFKVGV
ncbi:hypothetical protein [Fusobacterium polymorphum]|uniref:hypothetical protein n=1 Tax=Fusobacterium nucleatum subsp. polymorphum TaxID=76857 RepID=UPI0021C31D74|nr:hypothetical protein [Fusobacterium polymorphum]